MSDHTRLERPAGSICGKCRRFPNTFCFFLKHFPSTESAYVENLKDSTLANFIIFGLHAIAYAQNVDIFMCLYQI